MPRAFLITNKRYNSAVDYEDCYISREPSPERAVSTADGQLCIDDSAEDSEHSDASFQLFHPTSPKSPAHESNGPSSPRNAQDLTIPITKVTPTGQQCIISCYTNTDILTVVQQLMRQTNCTSLSKPAIKVFHSSTVPLIQHQKSLPKTSSVSPLPSTIETHTCPECGKRYSTSSNLARHRQTHRSVTDKKARKCPHCDKIYVSVPAYSMHVRTHSQGCQCPYCGKCFSRPWLLQGHIRTHTGEKPFTCPVCKKAFADKSNLRAHVQTHSDNKPYVCHRCGKAFALKSYLYKHEESSCMRLHRQVDKDNGENFKSEINPPVVKARLTITGS